MKFFENALSYMALGDSFSRAPIWSGSVIGPSTDVFPFNIDKSSREGDQNYIAPYYPLLPFTVYEKNPILTPNPANTWEANYAYNPTVIVVDDTIFMLYRAQDDKLTSYIGLAWSDDGYHFTRLSRPIISPTEEWETEGGCEDPRIVRVNGTFYLTYTGYNRPIGSPQLVVATSEDLINWKKSPPLFPGWMDVAINQDSGRMLPRLNHSKSGAIVREPDSEGFYHMYAHKTLDL